MKALAEQDACIGLAFKTLETMSLDKNEVYQAWAREKFWMDQQIRDEREEAERKRAREEGIEIGEKKGIEIGEKKGREEGKKEGIIQTAKAMIAKGIDIETICEITGLSPEDLT